MKKFYPITTRNGFRWQNILLAFLLIMSQSLFAQTYSLPIEGNDAVRCGAGELTLTVTWSGTALNPSNIKWYTQPFYGTPIATGMSYTTPYIEFTQAYYVDYIGDGGCSQCDRLLVRAVIADQVITPQVTYSSLVFCNSADQSFTPTVVGANDGTFSISPVVGGSSFNTSTGVFNPSGLTAGVYVVTFTPENVIGCDSNPVTVNLTVTSAPVQPSIYYSSPSYCSSNVPVSVSQTGANGGSYSASPSGLTINSSSGLITPSTSQTGNYTVTYLVSGGGGCAPVSATTEVGIIRLPVISTFTYPTPICGVLADLQVPTLTIEHDYSPSLTPYTYSGNGSLDLDPSTGAIDPSDSEAGNYTITYTIPAASPCGAVTASFDLVILPVSLATVSADKTQEYKNRTEPVVTFTGSVGPAPYTFTYRLDIGTGNNTVQGALTTLTTASALTATATVAQSTEVVGVFTYVLISVEDANGCTTPISNQSIQISIVETPDIGFIYASSPYCTNSGTATPSGSILGTFSYTGTGLTLNTTTGEVTLASSTAGTYEVVQTLNGYTSSAVIVITRLPIATFSYANASYCPSAGNVSPLVTNDIGIFTSNDPEMIFAEGANPGTIDAVFSPAGTYTITNTVQAANGCSVVSASTIITINAVPNYTGQRAYVICSGETTAITHSADIDGTTFSWTISDVTGSITGSSAGSGGSITQTLTNPSNTAIGSVTYMVTPTGGSCGAGVPVPVVVTVNPRPSIPTAGNLTVTYDGNEKVATASSSTMSSNSEAAVIDWYTAATGGDATTAPTGTDFGTYTAYAEARYASTGCTSTARTLVTLTINKKELTVINALITQRAYNGTTEAAITGAELSGIVSPDVVTIGVETSGTFASKNVGTGISVTTAMTISGTDVANYYLTQPTLTGNIIQKALTAASTIASKVYDGTATAGTITLGAITGLVDPETLTIATSATDYSNANVADGKSTTISYTLTNGTNGGLATNYSMADLTTSGNITPRPLTASSTISDKTYDGLAATGTVNLGTVSNLVSGESLSITPSAANFVNANVADGKTTTISYALANGVGGLAANYSMASIAATGDINPLLLTINNPSLTLSKVYDGNTTAAVTANAFTNKVGTDDVTINTVTANYDTKDVGSGKTITVVYTITGTAVVNYTKPDDYVVNTGVITTAPLTAATTVASKVYNGSAITGTVTLGAVSGYIGSETLVITPTASNYANANVGTAKATTISYGLANGTNGGVATNYSMANLETTGNITAKALTAATTVASKAYDGSAATGAVTLGTVTGYVGSETLAITPTASNYANANVGTAKATTISYGLANGTNGGVATNYSMANLETTGDITAKALTAATTVASKVYNGSAATGAVTLGAVTGYVGSETLAITPTATNYANANVGTAKATTINYGLANGTNGGVATNYNMANLSTSGNITAVTLTVTANNTLRGVGESTPAYSYTMSGFVNSETEAGLRTASALSGAVTFTDNTGGSTAAGSYTITPVVSALTATNYTFSATNGTLTISNVVVEATAGTARAAYSTLAAAYISINGGTHQGVITVHIYTSTTETASATLNSSGTGSASYTSVTIVPHANVTITGSASPLMILGN